MNVLSLSTPEITSSLIEKSIDFHCHGIGKFDFTDIPNLNLDEIEHLLGARNQHSMLTLYLPKPNFDHFLEMMELFDYGKRIGRYQHIAGISLEGPLLASHGGTPEEGVWMPTKQQWKDLAACGQKGLIYVILSPDAQLITNKTTPLFDATPSTVTWIAETLLEGGVLPAPGHFTKPDPVGSAKALQSIFDVVAAWGYGATITDHLYNDMPHAFKHAWRTSEEKLHRDEEIKALHLETWNIDSLEEKLGPVPAIMIKNARRGLVKICQNFDGEHVDLEVVKKSVELIGAENMIVMTDSIESKRLAGRELHMIENSTLLYQDQGIVAAGSQNIAHQIKNMFSIGLSIRQIDLITHRVPASIIQQHHSYMNSHYHAKTYCV